jgi:hypothetical protein
MIRITELLALLQDRLRGLVSQEEIAELMAEIMKLEEQWEELHLSHENAAHQGDPSIGPDIDWLTEQVERGVAALKLYRRRVPLAAHAGA